MKVRVAFALLPLLFLGSPVYAQSPCSECLKAAEKDLKKCLDNAISADDKISCAESRQAGMNVCVRGECTIERNQQATHDTRERLINSRLHEAIWFWMDQHGQSAGNLLVRARRYRGLPACRPPAASFAHTPARLSPTNAAVPRTDSPSRS